MLKITDIANFEERSEFIKNAVGTIENFPKEGILFRDICPLIADAKAFKASVDLLADFLKDEKVDAIVAADARGFIFGAALAYKMDIGVVMVRKKGKLPGKVISCDYDLEYGSNTLEMQENSLKKGDRVVVIDDLLATGGTAGAILELCQKFGAEVICFAPVIELFDLGGAKVLKDKYNVDTLSLVKFPGH